MNINIANSNNIIKKGQVEGALSKSKLIPLKHAKLNI